MHDEWIGARLFRRLLAALAYLANVILIVIGMLVVLPFFLQFGHGGFNQGRKAKISAARFQIANFMTAVQLYVHDNSHPPTTEQGLDALIHEPAREPHPKHWRKYMDNINEIPLDPWGNEYVYQSPGPRGEPYLIVTYGADGKPGGRGDDADITSQDPGRSP